MGHHHNLMGGPCTSHGRSMRGQREIRGSPLCRNVNHWAILERLQRVVCMGDLWETHGRPMGQHYMVDSWANTKYPWVDHGSPLHPWDTHG